MNQKPRHIRALRRAAFLRHACGLAMCRLQLVCEGLVAEKLPSEVKASNQYRIMKSAEEEYRRLADEC